MQLCKCTLEGIWQLVQISHVLVCLSNQLVSYIMPVLFFVESSFFQILVLVRVLGILITLAIHFCQIRIHNISLIVLCQRFGQHSVSLQICIDQIILILSIFLFSVFNAAEFGSGLK